MGLNNIKTIRILRWISIAIIALPLLIILFYDSLDKYHRIQIMAFIFLSSLLFLILSKLEIKLNIKNGEIKRYRKKGLEKVFFMFTGIGLFYIILQSIDYFQDKDFTVSQLFNGGIFLCIGLINYSKNYVTISKTSLNFSNTDDVKIRDISSIDLKEDSIDIRINNITRTIKHSEIREADRDGLIRDLEEMKLVNNL